MNIFHLGVIAEWVTSNSMQAELMKKIDLDQADKEVATTGNAKAEVEDNFCELDNDDNDAIQLYQSTDIPSYVSVIMHDVLLP